jgi:4-hydroxythreonine-4-phosphate dehydrogenase
VTRATDSPNKPRIGITTGDPAGIGPEVVLKSIVSAEVRESCSPVIIGDAREVRRQALALGLPCDYKVIGGDHLFPGEDDATIYDTGALGEAEWGAVSSEAGRSAIVAIEAATKLCLEGRVDAISTAPVNKEALRLAGSAFAGHTDMLAALCGSNESLMCFIAGDLRVFLLTIHTSLAAAIKSITRGRVAGAVELAERELRRFGIRRPRLAMAGLNPHAGENGLFGDEERKEIEPAIRELRGRGIDVSGPYPADTIFIRAARGEFDSVGACYHDQGLIAVKCLAFGKAVNVTLGLPIIRTSVDHGTAFDIAGRGVADPASMIEAILLAARLVREERRALHNVK